MMSSAIWEIFTEMENYRERGDKKNVMMEFFKLIRKHSAEIGSQQERERNLYQTSSRTGRPPGRPVCTNVHMVAQSTDWSTVAGERSTARSTDWHDKLSVGHGRPTGRLGAWVGRPPGRPTGVSGRRSVSPFRIRTSFLNWKQIQLRFLKFLGLFGYK